MPFTRLAVCVLLSLTASSTLLTACAKVKKSAYRDADIEANLSFTLSGSVQCDASFQNRSDPALPYIILDANDLVSCNSILMTDQGGGFYSVVLPYVSGKTFTINAFRSIDGS